MDALAVCGNIPSASISKHLCGAPNNGSSSLTYAQKLKLRTNHLSAFNTSSLLCFSPLPHHAKLRRRSNKTHIFLPHLVASMEEVEETYIMVKPDGVQRGLVGEIISRFEKKGFLLKGLKLFQCPKELAEEHYKDLKAKSFFPKLIDYITSGPVVCMAWEGIGVVASARKLIGATNPLQAEPGTIRGDLAVQTGRNVVHGSDSPENGKREIVRYPSAEIVVPFADINREMERVSEVTPVPKFESLWFKEGEVCQWTAAIAPWLRE